MLKLARINNRTHSTRILSANYSELDYSELHYYLNYIIILNYSELYYIIRYYLIIYTKQQFFNLNI